MKNLARLTPFLLTLFAASAVYGAPVISVTVKQNPGNKIVKQVTTSNDGRFLVGHLAPGGYTFEFRSQRPADVKDKQFSIAVDGTKSKGKQTVAGNSLVSGIAVTVQVGPKAHVTGQVVAGATTALKKKMVWMPPILGSNMPGRWVEEGSTDDVLSKNRINADSGAMLDRDRR